MAIGRRISELRKKNGLTQEQLAEELGTTRQAVSKWESEKSSPDIDSVIRMGTLFDVSMDYLLLGEDKLDKTHSPGLLPSTEPANKSNWKKLTYAILLLLGIILVCLLPLFASLYQGHMRNLFGGHYTNANDYLDEWPMLGVVFVSCIPLLVGLLGLCWPWLKWLFRQIKENWESA